MEEKLAFVPGKNGHLMCSHYILNAQQRYRVPTAYRVSIFTPSGALLAEAKDGVLVVDSPTLLKLQNFRPVGYLTHAYIQVALQTGHAVWTTSIDIRKVGNNG